MSLNNFASQGKGGGERTEGEEERKRTPCVLKIFFLYIFLLLSSVETPSMLESISISYVQTELKCYFFMSDFFLSFYIFQEFGGYITLPFLPHSWSMNLILLFSLLPPIPHLVHTKSQTLIHDSNLTLLMTFELQFWIPLFTLFSVASPITFLLWSAAGKKNNTFALVIVAKDLLLA